VAYLFHLNMQVYGGKNQIRNNLLDQALTKIQAKFGQKFLVAGFTEIGNALSGLNFGDRAKVLDFFLSKTVLIEVGTTAGKGAIEHLGIAWDPNYFEALDAGQVLYNSVKKRWIVYNKKGAPSAATIALPDVRGLGTDIRGLAYICGKWEYQDSLTKRQATQYLVVGFMHNMYSLSDRSLAFESLPSMRDALLSELGDPDPNDPTASWRTYIGGDFNLEPANPGASRGVLKYAAARYYQPKEKQYFYYDTTWAHTYDFWLSDQNIKDDDAELAADTRYDHASDHAAIILEL
jgi:hypothetical protein